MPVGESRVENIPNASTGSGPRHILSPPFTSIVHSPRALATIFVVLVLGSVVLLLKFFLGEHAENTYRDHWQQALKAIGESDLKLAQTNLNRCLQVAPFNAETHFLLARTCRRTEDFEGWLDHLKSAAVLGWPEDQIDLELRLKEAQVGNIWKVRTQLQNDLISGHPEEVLIVEALVKGFLENDNPKDACLLAEQWVQKLPDDWQAWLYHGRTFHYVMLYDTAIADYEKVLEFKPGQPQAQLWLAETFLSKGSFDHARELYRTYLENHPDDPDALLRLAKCQSSLGERENARATLDVLLSKNPNHSLALFARAKVEQAESAEKALPWLRRAAASAPNHPDILHDLYVALRALHLDKEADECEQRFKDCHAKVNQLVDLKMQLVKKMDSVGLRYQLAMLHLELGQEEEAAHWFQTILYIDPNHGPTLRALADYWQKRDDSKRAAYYRDRAESRQSPATFSVN